MFTVTMTHPAIGTTHLGRNETLGMVVWSTRATDHGVMLFPNEGEARWVAEWVKATQPDVADLVGISQEVVV